MSAIALRPKSKGPRRCAILLLALGLALGAYANPFVGDGSGPTPVQAGGSGSGALGAGQLSLRSRLAAYLSRWEAQGDGRVLALVLGVSFLYGIAHSLGPGHRKLVVFSLYIARPAKALEPLGAGLALAGLHGGAAILLLLAFKGSAAALSVATDKASILMEGIAYCLLIVLAAFLLVRAVADLVKAKVRTTDAMGLGTLILTGIYPCPGAILVLALSTSLGIFWSGIMAVLAMSLGMAIPITAFAYLGWFGRAGLLATLKGKEAAAARIGGVLEVFGLAFLLGFAVYIALPFIGGLL